MRWQFLVLHTCFLCLVIRVYLKITLLSFFHSFLLPLLFKFIGMSIGDKKKKKKKKKKGGLPVYRGQREESDLYCVFSVIFTLTAWHPFS